MYYVMTQQTRLLEAASWFLLGDWSREREIINNGDSNSEQEKPNPINFWSLRLWTFSRLADLLLARPPLRLWRSWTRHQCRNHADSSSEAPSSLHHQLQQGSWATSRSYEQRPLLHCCQIAECHQIQWRRFLFLKSLFHFQAMSCV